MTNPSCLLGTSSTSSASTNGNENSSCRCRCQSLGRPLSSFWNSACALPRSWKITASLSVFQKICASFVNIRVIAGRHSRSSPSTSKQSLVWCIRVISGFDFARIRILYFSEVYFVKEYVNFFAVNSIPKRLYIASNVGLMTDNRIGLCAQILSRKGVGEVFWQCLHGPREVVIPKWNYLTPNFVRIVNAPKDSSDT